jgi:hypothetical protein
MRYGTDDKFWVVVDPTPESEMGDILFETSLRGLELQFKGGLTMERNPTIFTDHQEAKYEAYGRLTAMRAAQAVLRASREHPEARIDRIEIYGADGQLVFEANLVDVNREQVRRGLAWVFRRDSHDEGDVAAEAEARAARRGLWADDNPEPPWAYRATRRRSGAEPVPEPP